MAHTVNIVNAFVDGEKGGNPAGVVLRADGLTAADKLRIAQLVGLSETAFVSASRVADVKLDFFTPTRQIAHCGHATIATFGLLAQRGIISRANASKETIDGTRQIMLRGQSAYMEQLAPTYFDEDAFSAGITTDRILASLDIKRDAIVAAPCVVATGNRFLLVHVRSGAVLAGLKPDMKEVGLIGEALGVVGYYVFTTEVEGFAATTRMFAPHYGIDEEAATGMAAGPLACYLHDRLGMRIPAFLIQQGAFMREPSPSRITVELNIREGKIANLFAGGNAKVVSSINIVL
ncbi:MAG TPA: PhzF family phenazine biosynthesis protein [Noviherbaspirillum sp.]|uniref:PhzF family phenazine biosynthesis protein n=1 Tax=Noviherbaspirillum sp. TaxID=1926288 RepID=UPI002D604942|nr:PhzF family phenazine biosynthesis protein [Noviherbaspirillum sp.]HYD96558.1 PhzF family phenazine biosynthesis protein [Noviherbaspirillum sp.]